MRRTFLIALILVFVSGFVPETSGFGAGEALAQQKPKTLLELLFGNNVKKKKKKAKSKAKAPAKRLNLKKATTSKRKKKSRKKARLKPKAPVVVAVEKNEDAAKVLVIGDFMAGQLAKGLDRMFAENPGLMVVDKSVALSGLVRDDVENWPQTASTYINEVKPITVIALVGMNDRQLIKTPSGKHQKLGEEWSRIYQTRTSGLVQAIRENRIPMIWVGLPPVSRQKMNSDYLVFNQLYRDAVESIGGGFVDVWDGFVDDEGRYVGSGPDINGQIVRLRRADGINMTAAGYEKLAFYTEKVLRRMTGFGKDALISSPFAAGLPEDFQQETYDPAATGKTVVVALGSPLADGGLILEGADGFLTANDVRNSSSFDLVGRGVGNSPRSGRIDANWGEASFSLPRGETPEPVLANMRGIKLGSIYDGQAGSTSAQSQAGQEITPAN